MSTKICTKCGVEKDVGEFGKNKNNKDGLATQCKKCRNEYEYNKHPEREHFDQYDEANPGFKICHTCKCERPIEEFSKDKKRKDGLDFRCKECSSKRGAKGREKLKLGIVKHDEPKFKICFKCKVEKPISEFYKDSNKKSGYSSLCKDCLKEQRLERDQNYLENCNCDDGFKICRKCGEKKPPHEFGNHNCSEDGHKKICKECSLKQHRILYPIVITENLTGVKICSTCNEELPLEKFSKDSREKDGHSCRCKQCDHKNYLIKTPNTKHAEDKYIPKEGFKVCPKCGIEKSVEEFDRHRNRKDGRASHCKKCKSEYAKDHLEERRKAQKRWEENNSEYRTEYNIKYHEENKEYLNGKCREYYYLNQDRLLEDKRIYSSTRRVEMSAWQKEYRKTPQGKINDMVAKQKRRSRVENLPCTLTPRQWLRILEMQNNSCAKCGEEFGDNLKPTQDHIIPVTNIWCYGLTFGNTSALCVSCNSKKHNTFKLGKAIDNLLVNL